ncbi:MAG: anaerobic ribonucleoside-triphosphate reductase activating protein, partial [Candidatus Aenigmarchaeota archaeon]|nr:anaerobic ribonucleoside-triphosphate reductase activating protein [Candidatus Aenigmarchaeota archaeon]
RCPYCHNPGLVFKTAELISEESILKTLSENKKWIDAVCITGGEPTIQADLPSFARKLKDLGFLVKLDTNGTNLEMIKQLLRENLLDYIAMDIKGAPEDYEKACGVKVDVALVKKSAEIIMKSGVDYEFRTTVVPGFFDENVARKIGRWIRDAKRYYLQQFVASGKMIDPKMQAVKAYSKEELKGFVEVLKPSFGVVGVRD